MHYSDETTHLHVQIESRGRDIPADEKARMEDALGPLGEAVREFPASDLRIDVLYHPHSAAYHVEFKLKVPGRTLFTGEWDAYLDAAFQRGLGKLLRRVEAYKENPDREAAGAAGRRAVLEREVMAPEGRDAGPLAEAVRRGSYRAFRNALAGYEEWLRKRVGRWVRRYPEAQAQVGRRLLLGDVVEEVYLQAFEGFTRRPLDVPLSEWLDRLIDPALKALLRHPDEERESASVARTMRQALLG
jgi:ribosome-associated translation inhibitor RaiA